MPVAVLHLDESCLGNGREGPNPGGAGGLIEVRSRGAILRRDFYMHSRATTNNRMALSGAIAVLQLLAEKDRRMRVLLVSDSEYLVKGIREWVPGWVARGWRRKTGAIENLPLWQALQESARLHDMQWTWVRGHHGHPKNEYANDLAVDAARKGKTSAGAVASKFESWLEAKRAKRHFVDYDPDAAFAALEQRLADGKVFPFSDEA